MTGPEQDRAALADMLDYTRRARRFTESGRFSLDDERTGDAVMYDLAIIGEAANRVSSELRAAHPEVPWPRIVGQRNILIHVYDRLDLDRVWDAVDQLLELEARIVGILAELPE